VALGGFMGVGKSTVGVILARRLGWPFLDSDAELVARHGSIAHQFQVEGEAVFRSRERALVEEWCDGVQRVVAFGGGVFADASLRQQLRRRYRLVTLQAPLSMLRERLRGRDDTRPLWGPGAEILYEERAVDYADVDLTVDATLSAQGVTEEIVQWLDQPS